MSLTGRLVTQEAVSLLSTEQIHLTSAKTPGNHDTFSTDYCTL